MNKNQNKLTPILIIFTVSKPQRYLSFDQQPGPNIADVNLGPLINIVVINVKVIATVFVDTARCPVKALLLALAKALVTALINVEEATEATWTTIEAVSPERRIAHVLGVKNVNYELELLRYGRPEPA